MRISSVSFFETDGYLFEEIKILLTQEFNDISTVNNIIEQIADGAVDAQRRYHRQPAQGVDGRQRAHHGVPHRGIYYIKEEVRPGDCLSAQDSSVV